MMRLEQRLQPVTRDRQWLRARQQGGKRPLADLDEKIAAVLDRHLPAYKRYRELYRPCRSNCTRRRSSSKALSHLFSKVLVKKQRHLREILLGLWCRGISLILGMRLAFEDLQFRIHACRSHLAVHAHRVTEKQIACARGQDSRWKPSEFTVDRRKHRVLRIMSV